MTKPDMDMDSQQTLDDKVIERLRQEMGEDAGLVIVSFVESIEEFLGNIGNRTAHTPTRDLHRWAHTIKSSAASIGAMRLACLAARLEESYCNREQIDLVTQLRVMRREYRRVYDSLQKLSLSI